MNHDSAHNAAPEKHNPDERTVALQFIQPIFDILDCENVGIVQFGEADEHMQQLFFSMDSDRSRTVSLDEFNHASPQAQAVKVILFQQIDSDGDNVLSGMEYRTYIDKAIRLIDTNRDSEVSLEEAELSPSMTQRSPNK